MSLSDPDQTGQSRSSRITAADTEQAHIQQCKCGRQHPLPGQSPAIELIVDGLAGRWESGRELQDVIMLFTGGITNCRIRSKSAASTRVPAAVR
jgi:hypothetical protein